MRSALTAAAVAATVALAGCGGSTHPAKPAPKHRSTPVAVRAARPAQPATLVYRGLYALSAPLRDPAAVALGAGRYALLGGLNAADESVAAIELGSAGGASTAPATLPLAQHDAEGALLSGTVYVFGGGSLSELDHIVAFDPAGGGVRVVGSLPAAQSDVAVSALGQTAYVVGGYDGTNWLNTILAYRAGGPVRVAGHLPVGLRYAATSAIDGRILIIGGSTPTQASSAIYVFDPATGAVRVLGHLPQPITHGGAATLGGFVYLVGGRGDNLNSQTADVWSIDPRRGVVRRAGRLPEPLSDAAVVGTGTAIVVAGGLTPSGSVPASVGELAPRP